MRTSKGTNPIPKNGGTSRARTKLIIAVGVLTLAVVYLVFSSVQASSAYYMTIGELKAAGREVGDKKIRVSGILDGGSVEWDARQLQLRFTLVDADEEMRVDYHGARPDMFNDGAEVIVEGRYAGDRFEATNLLLKCPSKYEDAA